MDFALEPARSGSPTCRLGSHYFHSSYDPVAEAERFLSRSLPDREAAAFILAGPCLGYLPELLRRRFPRALILSIQLSAWFRGRDGLPPASTWYPDSETGFEASLESFLGTALEEELCPGLVYLEWPPALQAFPREAEALRSSLPALLERLAASAATTKVSGRRWIANAARSFLLSEELVAFRPEASPIVLAAAGPSLDEAASSLLPLRGRFRLIAVSSALSALRARGLEPDLVVATDGGAWSRHHLYPLAARPLPLASPLAALPSASLLCPRLLLDQGFFPETELSALLGGGIRLPSHGTVAGSALALAARLGSGPLIAAGLDLAVRGLRSHAAPHGFDELASGRAGRLCPLEGGLWARESAAQPERLGQGEWRTARSLQVYAKALSRDAGALRGRLFRLHPSPVELEGFSRLEPRGLEALLDRAPPPSSRPLPLPAPPRARREELLEAALRRWIAGARAAVQELRSGGRPEPSYRDLFMAVDYPDWAAAGRSLRLGADPRPSLAALEAETLAFLSGLRERLMP